MKRTKKPPKVYQAKTAKEIFAIIRQFLEGSHAQWPGSLEQRRLWNVLTALRGPDDRNYDLKQATTAVLRFHLLGKPNTPAYATPDSKDSVKVRAALDTTDDHFAQHARDGFRALGLKWNRPNRGK